MERHGHTERDHLLLVAAGADPERTEPRSQPVQCLVLGCRRETWNQMGRCDGAHYQSPPMVKRPQLDARIHELETAIAEFLDGTGGGEAGLQWALEHPWGYISDVERESVDGRGAGGAA